MVGTEIFSKLELQEQGWLPLGWTLMSWITIDKYTTPGLGSCFTVYFFERLLIVHCFSKHCLIGFNICCH